MTDFIKYENTEYGEGIMLEEYNGTLSLVAAQEGKDGKVYMRWCYPQKDKKPIAKSIPWKIKLGNRDEALNIIGQLLDILNTEKVDDGEIPF